MNKAELQAKLDEAGVKYDKRWAEKKLQEAWDALDKAFPLVEVSPPAYTEEEIKNIEKVITGDTLIEDTLKMTVRMDGEVTTLNGLIIPPEVLTHYQKANWYYYAEQTAEKCAILRTVNGHTEFVREFSREVHKDGYKQLAAQFIAKNNK